MSRVPRLYVPEPLQAGTQVRLPADASSYAVKVLRLRAGNPVTLFDGNGRDFQATLETASKSNAVVQVISAGDDEPEPLLDIQLVLGVSRGQRMDYALQKATELGVTMLTPVFTTRSVVRLDDERRAQRLQHWRQVVISACEQSGRKRVPTLQSPQGFSEWLSGHEGSGLLLDPTAANTLADLPAPKGKVTLLIGPEGGLTPEERRQATNAGFSGIRLGPRILRTETAPLAAIAAMQILWGDFK